MLFEEDDCRTCLMYTDCGIEGVLKFMEDCPCRKCIVKGVCYFDCELREKWRQSHSPAMTYDGGLLFPSRFMSTRRKGE